MLGLTSHCLSLRSDRKVNKEKSKEEVCPHYRTQGDLGSFILCCPFQYLGAHTMLLNGQVVLGIC